jgi:prevent-host-death family protein
MKLGLREANQHFSKAIRAVRAGREVILTDRGQPIAVIKPLRSTDAQETALQAMAEEGLVILPTTRGPLLASRWRPVRAKGKPVSETVIEDREDRA